MSDFPGETPPFRQTFEEGEVTPNDSYEAQLEAARRLAVRYASVGEGGFQQIARIMNLPLHDSFLAESGYTVDDQAMWETMYRLFLTANNYVVPKTACKAASHCGGLYPCKDLPPMIGGASVADPGNHAYACLCQHLKDVYEETQRNDRDFQLPCQELEIGKDRFFTTTKEEALGDFVEAALGAADAALCVQEYVAGTLPHWKRSWSQIVGAGCGWGDRVTPWIDKWMRVWRLNGGCGCEACKIVYGGGSILNASAMPRVIRPPCQANASASAAGGDRRLIVAPEAAAQEAHAGIAAPGSRATISNDAPLESAGGDSVHRKRELGDEDPANPEWLLEVERDLTTAPCSTASSSQAVPHAAAVTGANHIRINRWTRRSAH